MALGRLFASAFAYILKSTVVIGSGSALFVGYEVATLNEKFYRTKVMPIIHRLLDGETAHEWGVRMARLGFFTRSAANCTEYDELRTTVFGEEFRNPIGLAAGFDKNGEAIENLRRSGFGFVEIGSVTPRPQPGNARPRIFRLVEDQAIINRYGFNSDGMGAVYERVRKARNGSTTEANAVPLGINIGKNKTSTSATDDYELGAIVFSPQCEYLVVNVSSPNTPGLRALQSRQQLVKILVTVRNAVREVTSYKEAAENQRRLPKLLLKIAPDLIDADLQDIAEVCLDRRNGIDGIIISNTTISRPPTLQSTLADETGGLSGAPLRQLSTDCIAQIYRLTEGRVPIVGCGGISSGEDAYEKIVAGASLVQLYSALVFQGFPVIGRMKRELVECLRRDGFDSVAEAVGAAHRNDPRITSSK